MYQKKTGVSSMAIILIFVYVSCFSGCSFFIETSGKVPITSVSVIDGDTIKAKVDGKIETIRLLLVDTPETKHPSLGKQPLGEDAKHFTRIRLQKQQTSNLNMTSQNAINMEDFLPISTWMESHYRKNY